MSYYNLTEAQRQIVIEILNKFSMNDLLTKSAYKGDRQEVIVEQDGVNIRFYAERFYKDMLSYKTNLNGDIYCEINNDIVYKVEDLKYIISWKDDNCIMRMVVPSNLLSTDLLKYFTAKVLEQGNFTESTDTEQIVYFNEMDGGDVLLTTYPQIIIEDK